MKPSEIYATVTNQIIELLEDHQQNLDRPWITFGQDQDYARNPTTGNYYKGINQFLLSIAMCRKDYIKNMWLTFKQAQNMDANVIKGSKSTPIIFYKTAHIDQNKKYYSDRVVKAMSSAEIANKGIEPIPVLKLYRVFNIAQIESLPDAWHECQKYIPLQDFEKDERAENFIRATGATINITQSNRAFYSRATDSITLPLREQFKGQSEPFYGVALHELGHWTGHSSRLNRTFGKAFGDTDYAKEELVAELTSAFCCASLGFSKNISANASYINSWLSVLKSDNKAIFRASALAQKAADFLFELQKEPMAEFSFYDH